MSMIMQYVRITGSQLDELRPLLVDDPDGAFEWLDRLIDSDPDDVPARESHCLDTDKTWDALNFLLRRHGGAPVDVIHGGVRLTEDEWGYEPPRYLTPAEVASAAAYLGATPFTDMAVHFDPTAMAEVYPGSWGNGDDWDSYLRFWYDAMTVFFTTAAAAGDGLLVYLM